MIDPSPCSNINGTATRFRACAVVTLKWKASSRYSGVVSRNGRGIAPPTLLITTSSRPNSLRATGGGDPLGYPIEVALGPRGDDDIGATLGEGERAGGPDSTAGPRHHRNLAIESEQIENH